MDLAWFTTRERDGDEVLPWDHLDSGLDRGWLWDDWQDALDSREQDDCRWTPCFDCGVCPQMGTEIQIGPTGERDGRGRPDAVADPGREPDLDAGPQPGAHRGSGHRPALTPTAGS